MTYIWQQLSPNSYLFWLLLISLFCTMLERFIPWRKNQPQLRKEIGQDIFFLFFNGFIFGITFYAGLHWLISKVYAINWGDKNIWPDLPNFAAALPLWGQFLAILLLKDFIEYLVHYQLHRRNFLWKFHRLHHSITVMDWIGNFRFHWMEIIIYDAAKWLPLLLLQADYRIYLSVAAFSTLIGHLNHANIKISWGWLRYVFNSPRMHIWHHDYRLHGKCGCNFAVVFSWWDWLFSTAYYPKHPIMPEDGLGFPAMHKLPPSAFGRLLYPFIK